MEKPGREDGNGQGEGWGEWEFPPPGESLAELEGADAQPQHVLPDLRHLQGQGEDWGVKTWDLGVKIWDLGVKIWDLGLGFVAITPGPVLGALGRV